MLCVCTKRVCVCYTELVCKAVRLAFSCRTSVISLPFIPIPWFWVLDSCHFFPKTFFYRALWWLPKGGRLRWKKHLLLNNVGRKKVMINSEIKVSCFVCNLPILTHQVITLYSTSPAIELGVHALYSTHTDYIRQNGAVRKMNWSLLGRFYCIRRNFNILFIISNLPKAIQV